MSSSPLRQPIDVVILAGPTCAGKSQLADDLASQSESRAYVLRAREVLASRIGSGAERRGLQAAGKELESSTGGAWLANAASAALKQAEYPSVVIVDSARTERQVGALKALASGGTVSVVALTASQDERSRRYEARRAGRRDDQAVPFDDMSTHPSEHTAEALKRIADLHVDTTGLAPEEVTAIVSRVLGTRHRAFAGTDRDS